jgi:hypothetical protein
VFFSATVLFNFSLHFEIKERKKKIFNMTFRCQSSFAAKRRFKAYPAVTQKPKQKRDFCSFLQEL